MVLIDYIVSTMKYYSLIICLLLASLTVHAQIPVGPYSYEEEIKICDKNANPVKLGEDVLGLALSSGGGVWYEVNPSDHNEILETDASNVFLALSRMPGEYHFVFVAKNNPCMPDASKALAKVIIIENPLSSNVNILLCTGDAPALHLIDLLTPQHQSLTVEFKDAAGNVLTGNTYSIPDDFEGDIELSYDILDADYLCDKSMNMVLVVERELDVANLPTSKTLSLCKNAVPVAVDLNTILGYTINGSWEVNAATTGATAPSPSGAIVDLQGLVITNYPANLVYTLIPSSGACYSSYSPKVTIVITEDLSTNFTDVNYEVCKTSSPTGYVNLMQLLGVNVPVNIGTWSPVDGFDNTSPIDIADGVFDLADARAGTYAYQYKISNAVELCGINDETAQVKITVYDSSEAVDGEVQLCDGVTEGELDLSKYIVGLPVSGVTWYNGRDVTGETLTDNKVSFAELNRGTQTFTYEYTAGVCGTSMGRLYVTLSDVLTNFKDREVMYCLTDFGSDAINLDQLLGVAGIPGTWTQYIAASTSDQSGTDGYWNQTSNIFDGFAAAIVDRDDANEPKSGPWTYVFEFTVDSDYSGCIAAGSKARITITMTEDL